MVRIILSVITCLSSSTSALKTFGLVGKKFVVAGDGRFRSEGKITEAARKFKDVDDSQYDLSQSSGFNHFGLDNCCNPELIDQIWELLKSSLCEHVGLRRGWYFGEEEVYRVWRSSQMNSLFKTEGQADTETEENLSVARRRDVVFRTAFNIATGCDTEDDLRLENCGLNQFSVLTKDKMKYFVLVADVCSAAYVVWNYFAHKHKDKADACMNSGHELKLVMARISEAFAYSFTTERAPPKEVLVFIKEGKKPDKKSKTPINLYDALGLGDVPDGTPIDFGYVMLRVFGWMHKQKKHKSCHLNEDLLSIIKGIFNLREPEEIRQKIFIALEKENDEEDIATQVRRECTTDAFKWELHLKDVAENIALELTGSAEGSLADVSWSEVVDLMKMVLKFDCRNGLMRIRVDQGFRVYEDFRREIGAAHGNALLGENYSKEIEQLTLFCGALMKVLFINEAVRCSIRGQDTDLAEIGFQRELFENAKFKELFHSFTCLRIPQELPIPRGEFESIGEVAVRLLKDKLVTHSHLKFDEEKESEF